MEIFRSDSGNLHREGLPAIDTGILQQWWWLGRLHNSRGPAVVSSYGTRQYYWRGVHIEKSLWDSAPTMPAQDILAIPNVEVRRAILERVGLGKLIALAKLLDEAPMPGIDRPNRLYKLACKGDEDLVFLCLTNCSLEPDGSRKDYCVRVPPSITRVRDGIAWTFDVKQDYEFIFES